MFLLEPMFARMLLPKLGGAPAVWNTCVVVYQVLLLSGYYVSHLLATRVSSLRNQALLYSLLLLAGCVVLPIGIAEQWAPPATENPVRAVFALLLGALGVPFLAMAATGPILQRWYVAVSGNASDPYALYAASNVGSLAALLAYPFVVEPRLSLRQQATLWSGGYLALCAVGLTCAAVTARVGRSDAAVETPRTSSDGDLWSNRFEWLGLALVPSTLMLSVTNFISTDIAAIPLLWIIPLAIYLGTLIVAFNGRTLVPPALLSFALPLAVMGVVALVLGGNSILGVRYAVVSHMAGFAVTALACHTALAARRPEASRLTEFYLWVAAGGALGGIFNTLVAPRLFVTPIEYPLAAIATCLLFSSKESARSSSPVFKVATTLLPAVLLLLLTVGIRRLDGWLPGSTAIKYLLAGGPALLTCLALWRSPVRMGLALATVFLAGSFLETSDRITLHVERTFFGVHRITYDGTARILMNGTTNHGAQSANRDLKCEPLTYYVRQGPVGQLFTVLERESPRSRFGVVGLGTASMAGYAKPGDSWTFFEINPAIERVAREPAFFTFLSDCAPSARVVIGDARLSLSREPEASLDVLFLDAFSSDAIPVHLLTREAIDLYFRKLAPSGVLAMHISNRYLNLTPLVAAIARDAGLVALGQQYVPSDEDLQINGQAFTSRWVMLTRRGSALAGLSSDQRWVRLMDDGTKSWTDDYSNVVGLIRR